MSKQTKQHRFGALSRAVMALVTILVCSGEVLAQVCAVPGRDGTTAVGNSYYPGTGSGGAGVGAGNTLTVGVARLASSAPGTFISETAFAPGDLAFIFQVQDAVFNTNNNNQYGDGVGDGTSPATQTATNFNGSGWTDLRNSGKYEFARVTNAVGTGGGTLTFSQALNFQYNTADATATTPRRRFQVIRVAQNSSLSLTGTINVVPWNGFTGGIIVYDVAGNLAAGSATINANGAGFRGGGGIVGGSAASGSVAYITSTADTAVNLGGRKGEGVAGTPDIVRGPTSAVNVTITAGGRTVSTPGVGTSPTANGVSAGLGAGDLGYPGATSGGVASRGAPANAGGGATTHNAGGGGGSNRGAGGQGAHSFGFYQATSTNPPCVPPFINEVGTLVAPFPVGTTWFSCGGDGSRFVGGRPGRAFVTADYENPGNRLILGGGGGAGDGNNQSDNTGAAQTSGGNGGGVIFIRANTISATGFTINTNGQAGLPSGRDGAGAGGAGGTVAIFTTTTSLAGITVNAQGGAGGESGVPLFDNETQGGGGGGGGGAVLIPPGASGIVTNVLGGQAGRNFQDNDDNIATAPISNTQGAGAGGGAVGTVNFNNNQVVGPSNCVANLTVAKNSLPNITGGNTFPAGTTTVQYSITISNGAGRSPAAGVNVVDNLPAPFTFTGTTATVAFNNGATFANGATTPLTIATGTGSTPAVPVFGNAGSGGLTSFLIPGGGSVTLTFTVNVNGAVAGTYQNPATVNFTDPVTGAVSTTPVQYVSASSSNDDVTILAAPTVLKAFDPIFVVPGGISRLTITLGNTNTVQATLTAAFADTMPGSVILATPTGVATTCLAPGTGPTTATPTTTANSVGLPLGARIPANGTCTLSVDVLSNTAGSFNNVIPANTLQSSVGNAALTAATLAVTQPQKSVRLFTDVDTSGFPSVNDIVEYRIVFSNPNLPDLGLGLTQFQITDATLAQLGNAIAGSPIIESQTLTSPAATINSGFTGKAGNTTLLSSPVTLGAGGSIVVRFRAPIVAATPSPIDNTATVTSTLAGFPPTGLPSDADIEATATFTAPLAQPNDVDTPPQTNPTQVPIVAPNADLVVTKSQPSPATVGPGGTITYTVTVTNNGPATASNVVVTDTLPAGTTLVVGSTTTGFSQAGQVLTWDSTGPENVPALASLANGASQTFTVVVTAP